MASTHTTFGNKTFISAVLSATTAENDVGNGPRRLYKAVVHNDHTSALYLKIWDSLAPTVGTTGPDYCHEIPADSMRTISYNEAGSTPGVAMATGVSFGGSDTGGTGAGSAPTTLRVTLVLENIDT